MVARIKKNDTVKVLSGKNKGQKGSVIKVLPLEGKVMVKDVAVITKHVKVRQKGDVAGIKKHESFIDISKVMPICPACKKPCRVNTVVLEGGKKVRVCNKCKEVM
jgi:large subunit ribosomal protein L24